MRVAGTRAPLSSFNEQYMHRSVCKHDEDAAYYSETNAVPPQRTVVKSKGAQDGSAGDFDIKTLLVIDQAQLPHFVDDEALEAVMEN